jgi:3,4-dihydroxy 2-butanone 4-phosphate synthase / GTP cyclohydrolase II
MAFASIPELLADIKAGKMVILADDEDRENEGDLIMAAVKVRPEDINFMARHARGLICLGLSANRCEKLGLRLMVSDNRTQYQTAFTVSIEAAEGVTTGISAFDRAHTIQTAVKAGAHSDDLRQPGHIFPLMAKPGGVLSRAGHTEAACDLSALAGLEPAGVLVEILAEDGTMARRPELELFAQTHGLKMGTIADLIRFRLETEKTIERVLDTQVQTEFGAFRLVAYRDLVTLPGTTQLLHYALVKGEIHAQMPVLVRVHVNDILSDVLTVVAPDVALPLRPALEVIAAAGNGVAVLLQSSVNLQTQLLQLQSSTGQAAHEPSPNQWRTHGLGAQILSDLGARKLRVLGKPRKFSGLSGFGLEVVEQVPM